MTQTFSIATLPGDGIGPEVVDQAVRVLELVSEKSTNFKLQIRPHDFGGAAIDATGAVSYTHLTLPTNREV